MYDIIASEPTTDKAVDKGPKPSKDAAKAAAEHTEPPECAAAALAAENIAAARARLT